MNISRKQNDVPYSPLVLIVLILGLIAGVHVARLPRCEKCGMFCSVEDRVGSLAYFCCGVDTTVEIADNGNR